MQNTVRTDENQPCAFLLFALLLIYDNYRIAILSCKEGQANKANDHQIVIMIFTTTNNINNNSISLHQCGGGGSLPDDCVS